MNKDKFTWHEGEVTIEAIQCTTCRHKKPNLICGKTGKKIPAFIVNRKKKCGMYENFNEAT